MRKTKSQPRTGARSLQAEVDQLRQRLAVADETLRAIRAGEVDALVVSGRDGDRVFTLTGAEQPYRVLVEAMSEGAATIDADGSIIYCNQHFADLLRLPLDKIVGRLVSRFVLESDRDKFDALFKASFPQNHAELQLRTAEATLVPVYASVTRVRVEGAEIACFVVTNLTEQKRDEQILLAANLAQLVFRNTTEAIAVCDNDGKIVLASDALRELCDRSVIFEHFDSLLHLHFEPRSSRPRSFHVAAATAGEVLRTVEVSFERHDGRTFFLLLSAVPLKADNRTLGCVVTLTDITEKRLTEQALLRSEKLAAAGRLAATIAHELNNPLQSIADILYIIQCNPGNEGNRDLARTGLGELSRATHITRQTLTFFRNPTRPEPLRVDDLLRDLLSLFSRQIQSKRISVEHRVEYREPIVSFSAELRHIFSNLVRNAIEALPEDGRLLLHVRPALSWQRSGVRVFIADNGPGVPSHLRRRIFEPFFTTKDGSGNGLGLWVVSDLLQKQGGRIRLRSREQQGTCFYVFIPTASAPSAQFLPPTG